MQASSSTVRKTVLAVSLSSSLKRFLISGKRSSSVIALYTTTTNIASATYFLLVYTKVSCADYDKADIIGIGVVTVESD